MPSRTRTVQESEEFAKNWQVDAIYKQVEDNEVNRKTDSEEIKGLINSLGTKIDNKLVTKDELRAAIDKVHAEYRPQKKFLIWMGSALGILIITYFFQLFANLFKVVAS